MLILAKTARRLCPALVFAAILVVLSPVISASSHSRNFTIYFPVSKAVIDPSLYENRQTLDSLQRLAVYLASDSSLAVTSVRFGGYVSPEGPDELNRRLSRDRRRAIEQFVSAYYRWPDSVVQTDHALYDSSEAENYFKASPDRKSDMHKSFGRRRNATVEITYEKIEPRPEPEIVAEVIESVDETATVQPADTAVCPEPEPLEPAPVIPATPAAPPAQDTLAVVRCKPLYIGLKTNMLYDALLIPTLGAEIYVGRNFSISGQWSYAWWSRDINHRYWRYYGGDLALRRWFGSKARRKPLTGHHLGVYAQLFTYDFETGGRGEMGAKFNYGGGIEYGFSLPVSRRLNIDFSIGVGYIAGRYYEYIPIDNHYVWQATRNRKWFGPTKAEISLVWLIGCDNYNVKGGSR